MNLCLLIPESHNRRVDERSNPIDTIVSFYLLHNHLWLLIICYALILRISIVLGVIIIFCFMKFSPFR